jgi:small subunit ribosomal protein S4
MAKYLGPACKLCRREGEKLFLKGERCFSPKCAIDKREFAPGQHGRGNQRGGADRTSDFARQLRAKQKARRIYGVMERQFRRYYEISLRRRGLTGFNLLQTLEMRLDNIVFRMGYAPNRDTARQLVNHGHFTVNEQRTNIPSALIKPGDVISVDGNSRATTYFKQVGDFAEQRTVPTWIDRNLRDLSGKVLRLPERAEIDGNLNEQLIIEYYSRR